MKNLLLILLLMNFSGVIAQVNDTNLYDINSSIINNPERGFYHHTEVHSAVYNPLNETNLISYIENEKITQILRVFYLEDFINGPISQDYINNMHKDFNIARKAGVKVILRMAYSQSQSAQFKDASPEVVKTHMLQLKEIFEMHSDVIATIQTGFIGVWGEWYYSDFYAGDLPHIVTDENWMDRAEIVNNYLDIVPKDRRIQLRTPGYKMKIFGTEEPIDVSQIYDQTNITRVGHHNDCFVASSSDFGTYINAEVEKPYLEKETNYLPMGGETCALAPPYSDCENAYAQLQRFHWSYLNIDYNKSVLNTWKDQGCYDDVELNLGYRIYIKEATIRNEIHPNGTFNLNLTLHNQGFANPYNPRNLNVILVSNSTEKKYSLQTKTRILEWPINEDFEVEISAGFPENIVEDTYQVYLVLPDSYQSIHENPNYAIQLANNNMWEEEFGYNNLNFDLKINSSNTVESYEGDSYFTSINDPTLDEIGPKEIYIGDNDGSRIVFWGRSQNHITRNIERSTDGINFMTLATIDAEIDFYREFEQNDDFYYRFSLQNENNEISYSDVVFIPASTITSNKIEIDIDGMSLDWKDVSPNASLLDASNSSYIIRTYFDAEHASFILTGSIDNFKLYLNTDISIETGNDETNIRQGMDYMIENNQLFEFNNGSWSETEVSVKLITSNNIIELQIPLSSLKNISNNAIIPLAVELNDQTLVLSENETSPANYIRQIPAQIPTGLKIENSVAYPDIRLEVYWDGCKYCDGYILESSENGTDFTVLEDLSADKVQYFHDFLDDGTYYYRIKAYNNLGESLYSSIEKGTIGPVINKNIEYLNSWQLTPNPTNNILYFNHNFRSYNIYNARGKLVYTSDIIGDHIDVSTFASGSYFLVIQPKEEAKKVNLRFIKL